MALGITTDAGMSDANGDAIIAPASYTTRIPNNGRIIQNIIQGSDLVMSHITHLYQLSALDFINTEAFPPMGPWVPSYTAGDMLVATGLSGGAGATAIANTLVSHYVEALSIRRKAHTMGALFSGRQPIQNAMVPGGVTTLYSTTMPTNATAGTLDKFGPFNSAETKLRFTSLLNDVRDFIDQKYILDVVTVANAYSQFWNTASGCMNLLSYGDYPTNGTGSFLIKRGLVRTTTTAVFNQADIREYVGYSWYDYNTLDTATTGKHPFEGITTPDKNTSGAKYSWLKAPRIGTEAFEVGPLARMVRTALSTTQQSVTSKNAIGGPITIGASYNAFQLVTTALSLCTTNTGSAATLAQLYSPLGRHAARALEAKYVADAMAGWVNTLTDNGQCYTYARIPKQIATGYGLTEAPRGALGHWIKIEGRKVAKYQCVVPSTWNFSPSYATLGTAANHGAVEQSLMDANIGAGTTFAARSQQIVNILRVVHPFDCCVACAVHVVNPEGKELMKFAIDPDGRPTNVKINE